MIYVIITLSILLLGSLYANYQMYRKILFFEQWYENFAEIVENIYENMKMMDERGVMEEDDNFGMFFEAMKNMMMELFSMGFYEPEDLENVEINDE